MKNSAQLVAHVKNNNPMGRGKPYNIRLLVQRFGLSPHRPKRLTQHMRIILDDILKSVGIYGEKILDENAESTRLQILSPST